MSQTNLISQTTSTLLRYGTLTPKVNGIGLLVAINYADGEFYASVIDPKEIDAYGVGDFEDQAVMDLLYALQESLQILEDERHNLSPKLQNELQALRAVFSPQKLYTGTNATGFMLGYKGGRAVIG